MIRNVFPEEKRAAVVDLVLLRLSSGSVGGNIGVNRKAGDLIWETYCEAPNAPIDAALIHEVILVGVGTFNEIVKQVREVVAGLSPWTCMEDGDDGMIWN